MKEKEKRMTGKHETFMVVTLGKTTVLAGARSFAHSVVIWPPNKLRVQK